MRDTYLGLFTLFILYSGNVYSETTDEQSIQFSGFARLIGGGLISDDKSLFNYDKQLTVDKDSLLGLQMEYAISDDLSVTGQLLGKTQGPNSGLEWLYLNYQVNDAWQVKLGKLHTPFFDYSDVINVGYAYPWVTLPSEVYDSFFFQSFQGSMLDYSWLADEFNLSAQAYFGQVDEEVQVGDEIYKVKVNFFGGTALNINRGPFRVRISKTIGDYIVDDIGFSDVESMFETVGKQIPIYSSAAQVLNIDGNIDFTQISFSYDLVNLFLQGEWIQIHHDINLLPELDGYYLSAGYLYEQFTFHLTFSERNGHYSTELPLLPPTNDVNIDSAAELFNDLARKRPEFDSHSITLGTRWDYQAGLAFKLDIRWVNGDAKISLPTSVTDSFDGRATILSGGVEWVF